MLAAAGAQSAFGADVQVIGAKNTDGKRTVSLSAINGPSSIVKEFSAVLASDLTRSGYFKTGDGMQATVVVSGDIQFNSAQYRASMSVTSLGGARNEQWSLVFAPDKMRDAAHALSDFITEKIAGKPGMASSKILLVGKRGAAESEIFVCDADGSRLRQITSDKKLCLSPAWFYDRNAFLYTSWHSGSPAVYKINLDDNHRELVASHPGMNQGATPAPNEPIMAIVLSRSGGIDLWVQDLATKKLARITSSKNAKEASPAWSPDGKNLVYASSVNDNSPQIHTMSVADKTPRLLPLGNKSIRESTSPEWNTANKITFCGRTDGRYKIYTVSPSGANLALVSPDDDADYEDPSWAPDARHIVCTKTVNYKRSLAILDTQGDPAQTLFTVSGDWYLPHWSRANNPMK